MIALMIRLIEERDGDMARVLYGDSSSLCRCGVVVALLSGVWERIDGLIVAVGSGVFVSC